MQRRVLTGTNLPDLVTANLRRFLFATFLSYPPSSREQLTFKSEARRRENDENIKWAFQAVILWYSRFSCLNLQIP